MEIKTKRLTLRPLGPGDLETTHAYASDAANTEYMVFLPNETREETLRFLEDAAAEWLKPRPAYYEFAVLLGGAHIGAVSLYLEGEPDAAELGWILHRDHHGHGYATEAAAALIPFARDALGVRRLIAHCDAENRASQGVMRKLGLTLADTSGTRKNRGSDEVRTEYRYEMAL